MCVQITITANGRNVVTSTAGPGGVEPLVNIVDVVNDLSARGHTLKAGHTVITGAIALAKPGACIEGDHVVVSYEGLGEVELTLAGGVLKGRL